MERTRGLPVADAVARTQVATTTRLAPATATTKAEAAAVTRTSGGGTGRHVGTRVCLGGRAKGIDASVVGTTTPLAV